MSVTEEIEAALGFSDDQLFVALASGVSKGASATDLLRRGKEIYGNLKSKLQDRICQSEGVRSAFEKGDKVALVAALADCISGVTTGVSPVTFCVLLVKEGVSLLCEIQWKNRIQ